MTQEIQKTVIGWTETSEGPIAHLELAYDGGVLHAPVKVVTGMRGSKGEPMPYRRDGRLVFALPGGREVVA